MTTIACPNKDIDIDLYVGTNHESCPICSGQKHVNSIYANVYKFLYGVINWYDAYLLGNFEDLRVNLKKDNFERLLKFLNANKIEFVISHRKNIYYVKDVNIISIDEDGNENPIIKKEVERKTPYTYLEIKNKDFGAPVLFQVVGEFINSGEIPLVDQITEIKRMLEFTNGK